MYKIMKIYYDKVTGEVVWGVSYNQDIIVDFDHDFSTMKVLNEREKESMELMLLHDGQFSQDFSECNGYRVNVTTQTLEFSYPDPNEPELPPIYQKPLSKVVAVLEQENSMIQMGMMEMTLYAATQDERLQTQENAVMELSMLIAGGGM